MALLKASEQHLFRRGQVRQVLAYLRDAYPDRYVEELGGLLSDDGIRPHLKDLVFTLLAEVTNPTDDEWATWTTWIEPQLSALENDTPNADKLSTLAWRRFFAARSWFAEIDRRGLIERWLAADNDRFADMAVNYLRFHQHHSPDRVAALLEPYVGRDGEWRLRLRSLMESAEYHTSRRFFTLFLRLMDNGTLDEARDRFATNGTFWLMLHSLGEHRPGVAAPRYWPKTASSTARHHSAADGAELRSGALLDHDQFVSELVVKSAATAPVAFVDHLLPVVLEISDAAASGDTLPKRDAEWPMFFKSEYLNGEDACLSELAGALAVLARTGTVPLRDVIADLRRWDTHTANYLLLSLYRGGASRYADEAIALLCDEQWRFECGFSDSPNWCVMETIRAVIPFCSMESRERIEAVILDYVPAHERSPLGYRQFGRTRFDLLSAIPAELRSKTANARFDELTRKFGDPAAAPKGITITSVESPIEKKATEKMTDDQWLRAIAKYPSENRIDHSGDGPTGGARELARVLEERIKEAPNRFARLGLRFPADANPVYLVRTLGALSDTAVVDDLKLQLCRKAFAEARSSCGRSITAVLGKIEAALPDDAVEMLDWLATQDDDPAVELRQQDAGGGQEYNNGDVHFHGINTTRGQAVGAIGDLILRNATYIGRFRTTLDKMVRDPSTAVLSCVAGTLRAVAYHDISLGMSLFQGMDLSEDRLLATRHVCKFIRDRLNDRLSEWRPIIERMLRSSEPDVREAGARLACLSALQHESAADLANEALRGDVRGRLGAAKVASANIGDPECRVRCEAMLVRLFADADADVRRKAASCFGSLRDKTLEAYGELIAAFCDSPAFGEATSWLLRALERSRTATGNHVRGLQEVPWSPGRRELSDRSLHGRTYRRDAHLPNVPAAPERQMDQALIGSDRSPLSRGYCRRRKRVGKVRTVVPTGARALTHDGRQEDLRDRRTERRRQDDVRHRVPAERGRLPHFRQRGSHRSRPESFSFRSGYRPGRQTDAEADRRARAARTQLRLRDDAERTPSRAPDSPVAGAGLPGQAVLPASAHRGDGHRTCRTARVGGWPRRAPGGGRRRFYAGWRNFERIYRDLVDAWAVYDNSGDVPLLIAEGNRR